MSAFVLVPATARLLGLEIDPRGWCPPNASRTSSRCVAADGWRVVAARRRGGAGRRATRRVVWCRISADACRVRFTVAVCRDGARSPASPFQIGRNQLMHAFGTPAATAYIELFQLPATGMLAG